MSACAAPPGKADADLPLRGTNWQVLPAQAPEMSPPPAAELLLQTTDLHYSAFTGCNRLNGVFRLEGQQLELMMGGMTRMACAPPQDATERRFLDALPLVRSWQVQGHQLQLLNEQKQPLLLLRAAPAKR